MNKQAIQNFISKYGFAIVAAVVTLVDGIAVANQDDELESIRKELAELRAERSISNE